MEGLLTLKDAVRAELHRMHEDALRLAKRISVARERFGEQYFIFKVSIRAFGQHNISASSAKLEEAVAQAVDCYKRINRCNPAGGNWAVVVRVAEGIEVPLQEDFWSHLKPAD